MDKLAGYNTNHMTLVSYFMCAETDEEARRRADGIPFFQFTLKYYSAGRLGKTATDRRPGRSTLCRIREMEDGESGRSRAGHLGRSAWLAGDDPQPLARVFDIACRPNHPVEPSG